MPATKITQYETTDWTDLSTAPSAVTYNGNRSYSLTFSGRDYTSILSPGQRLRTTRTVAAPTQCTSLNGTNQYFNKTSPAGMTFTNNFVVSAWVKLSSYAAADMTIASRYNGTSGWALYIQSTGQINLAGWNGGAANFSVVQSYQSIPLNRWVHITAQLDMATFTATTTTSYIMIDGVDVPATVARGGTNPTALVQAGNLEIGSQNGGTKPFPGKIAQPAVFNAKVTQATIRGYISQGLAGNETSLISAYSFNNSINDLNTTNANNLTAQNSAVATNADSPFGGQAGGTISSTLDYGIIQSDTFSTDTTVVVQVPEGCTIPTSGGVSSVAFSGIKAPYGMPAQKTKWTIEHVTYARVSKGSPVNNTVYNYGNNLTIPIGNWIVGYKCHPYEAVTAAGNNLEQRIDLDPTAVSGAFPTSTGTAYVATSNFSASTYLVNASEWGAEVSAVSPLSLSSQTTYWLNHKTTFTGTGSASAFLSDFSSTRIYAENAYL